MSCGCNQCKQLRAALDEKDRQIAELAAKTEKAVALLYLLYEAYELVNDGSMQSSQWEAFKKVCAGISLLNQLDPAAILAARDAVVQAEVTELKAENVKLAAGLESADHGYYCESTMKRVPENQRQCNCWKSKLDPVAILAAHDKALTGPLEARIAELERDVWSDPELLAHFFHDEYEKLAPAYDYETRKASAVAWADVPEKNKALMVAVCESAIKQRRDAAREAVSAWRPETYDLGAYIDFGLPFVCLLIIEADRLSKENP